MIYASKANHLFPAKPKEKKKPFNLLILQFNKGHGQMHVAKTSFNTPKVM